MWTEHRTTELVFPAFPGMPPGLVAGPQNDAPGAAGSFNDCSKVCTVCKGVSATLPDAGDLNPKHRRNPLP